MKAVEVWYPQGFRSLDIATEFLSSSVVFFKAENNSMTHTNSLMPRGVQYVVLGLYAAV